MRPVQQAILTVYYTLPSLVHSYTFPPHLQADALYKEAVSHGLFPSQWQRPVIYERGLRAAPFWSTQDLRAYGTELSRVMTQLAEIKKWGFAFTGCMCLVIMHTHSFTHTHAHTHMHRHKHTCTHAHTHTRTHARACAHTHRWALSSCCTEKACRYWRRMPLCSELRTLPFLPLGTGAHSPSLIKERRMLTTATSLPRHALYWTPSVMHLSAHTDRWVDLDCIIAKTQSKTQFCDWRIRTLVVEKCH